jgi:hypothetical protein
MCLRSCEIISTVSSLILLQHLDNKTLLIARSLALHPLAFPDVAARLSKLVQYDREDASVLAQTNQYVLLGSQSPHD